jgi:hypothetical protein
MIVLCGAPVLLRHLGMGQLFASLLERTPTALKENAGVLLSMHYRYQGSAASAASTGYLWKYVSFAVLCSCVQKVARSGRATLQQLFIGRELG